MLTLLKVICYTTPDGKTFATEKEGLDYVADKAREILALRLQPMVAAGKLSAGDKFNVVMALIPDGHAAHTLAGLLSNVADW